MSCSAGGVDELLAEQWQRLSSEEKKNFNTLAEQDMARQPSLKTRLLPWECPWECPCGKRHRNANAARSHVSRVCAKYATVERRALPLCSGLYLMFVCFCLCVFI